MTESETSAQAMTNRLEKRSLIERHVVPADAGT